MFEALILFFRELLIKEAVDGIDGHNFNKSKILFRIVVTLSIVINLLLIHRLYSLAKNHYQLNKLIVRLEEKRPECYISYDEDKNKYYYGKPVDNEPTEIK